MICILKYVTGCLNGGHAARLDWPNTAGQCQLVNIPERVLPNYRVAWIIPYSKRGGRFFRNQAVIETWLASHLARKTLNLMPSQPSGQCFNLSPPDRHLMPRWLDIRYWQSFKANSTTGCYAVKNCMKPFLSGTSAGYTGKLSLISPESTFLINSFCC